MSDYEPGTVAVATVNGEPGRRVVLDPNGDWFTCDDGDLVWGGGSEFTESLELSGVRPLVVLDLNDRDPRRLVGHLRSCPDCDCGERGDWCGDLANQIEAQARPPKPPKPEEPTGLGAVVEADYQTDEGKGFGPAKWVSSEEGSWVCLTDGLVGTRAPWPFLTNVRVLSEGVS